MQSANKNTKALSRHATASSAVSFACWYQALQTGQPWLVVTGIIFFVIAIALFVKAWSRDPG